MSPAGLLSPQSNVFSDKSEKKEMKPDNKDNDKEKDKDKDKETELLYEELITFFKDMHPYDRTN